MADADGVYYIGKHYAEPVDVRCVTLTAEAGPLGGFHWCLDGWMGADGWQEVACAGRHDANHIGPYEIYALAPSPPPGASAASAHPPAPPAFPPLAETNPFIAPLDAGWEGSEGNMLCGAGGYYLSDPSVTVVHRRVTFDECFSLAATYKAEWQSTNPLVAWQWERCQPGSPGCNGAADAVGTHERDACYLHRFKILQKAPFVGDADDDELRSPSVFAGGAPPVQHCPREADQQIVSPVFVYYAPDAVMPAPYEGWRIAVGSLATAQGTAATATEASPRSHLAAATSLDDCHAACEQDAACVAFQYREDSAPPACHAVSKDILKRSDVAEVDVGGWARRQGGDGILYYREPPPPSAATPSPPPSSTTPSGPAPMVEEVPHFAYKVTNGASLLFSQGSSYISQPDKTAVYDGVTSVAGCATIARRLACTKNPVLAFQVVDGRCVVQRQAFFDAWGFVGGVEAFVGRLADAPLSRSQSTTPPRPMTPGHNGTIYYATAPPACTTNPDNATSPCAEGAAAAVCTGNPAELCYFDLSCKDGGLGCFAAGWTGCRFCGFGHYTNECPAAAESQPTLEATVVVPSTCPQVCDADATHRCFLDTACSDPLSPGYRNGLGCDANGKGANCRYCGFGGYAECPAAEDQAAALHSTINVAVETADPLGGGGVTTDTSFVTEIALAVLGPPMVAAAAAAPAADEPPSPSPPPPLPSPPASSPPPPLPSPPPPSPSEPLPATACGRPVASRSTRRRRRCVSSRPSRSRGSPFGWARGAASRPSRRAARSPTPASRTASSTMAAARTSSPPPAAPPTAARCSRRPTAARCSSGSRRCRRAAPSAPLPSGAWPRAPTTRTSPSATPHPRRRHHRRRPARRRGARPARRRRRWCTSPGRRRLTCSPHWRALATPCAGLRCGGGRCALSVATSALPDAQCSPALATAATSQPPPPSARASSSPPRRARRLRRCRSGSGGSCRRRPTRRLTRTR